MSIKVRGEREAMRNLNREIGKIEGDISKGLKAALVFIQGKSVEVAPEEHGPLRGSAFNDVDPKTLKGRVGYTIDYAPFVHEMPETNNFTTPDTGPKFLSNPIFQNTRIILAIIAKRAKR